MVIDVDHVHIKSCSRPHCLQKDVAPVALRVPAAAAGWSARRAWHRDVKAKQCGKFGRVQVQVCTLRACKHAPKVESFSYAGGPPPSVAPLADERAPLHTTSQSSLQASFSDRVDGVPMAICKALCCLGVDRDRRDGEGSCPRNSSVVLTLNEQHVDVAAVYEDCQA